MILYQCRVCNGVYDKDQPGGYNHACPPAGSKVDKLGREVSVERKNKRDENKDEDPKGRVDVLD